MRAGVAVWRPVSIVPRAVLTDDLSDFLMLGVDVLDATLGVSFFDIVPSSSFVLLIGPQSLESSRGGRSVVTGIRVLLFASRVPPGRADFRLP